ncbi:TPA: CPBP family intramembrane glutamic endopeptidase [Photobacterium damselae]|uniref:CPBP family intramembrane glutamic endopeptidase n=1 Tax=Photobacterium damselae TaxID=38293 RepID=UPI001EDD959D|nr:CPBP family intramembrane glutamic endopeptidase [Photobacterium damselae]MCG3826053.1 CPBP family intramembrane metalloprotease [Photobacterium damselae]
MFIFPSTPELIVWLLLAVSIVTAISSSKPWWSLPLGLTLISALWVGVLTPIGAFVVIIGLAIAYITQKFSRGYWHIAGHIFVLGWAIALTIHALPGFHNLLVLEKVITSPDSVPFTLYFNLDKPMIVFGLLLLLPNMVGDKPIVWQLTAKQWLGIGVGLVVLPLVAMGVGIVKPDFTVPSWIGWFIFNNLLFTCVAEEVLFRGYIQTQLARKLPIVWAIIFASLLFGIAHIAGGVMLVIVAALAGGLYGLSYYWSKKLTLAIAVHFGFNLIHLLFFTYPLLKA